MAQFEIINFDNGNLQRGINIRKVVGWAGADLKEDVVRALGSNSRLLTG